LEINAFGAGNSFARLAAIGANRRVVFKRLKNEFFYCTVGTSAKYRVLSECET